MHRRTLIGCKDVLLICQQIISTDARRFRITQQTEFLSTDSLKEHGGPAEISEQLALHPSFTSLGLPLQLFLGDKSPDTVTFHESMPASTHTDMPVSSGVNVAAAKEEFAELSRQLSRKSTGINDRNSTSTAKDSPRESKDLEKGELADNSGSFDLKEYLSSSNDANQSAGIKHKVNGVLVWFMFCYINQAEIERWCHVGRSQC